jgi:hypothetical protein
VHSTLGIQRHAGKDITGSLNGTAIGIDLVNGTKLFGNAFKISILLPALLEVIRIGTLRPVDMAVLLGHVQWLNLLNRPLFSVLRFTYAFARDPDQLRPKAVPCNVQTELAAILGLALFWSFDLTKPWHDEILASDASPSYGFGVSRLAAPPGVSKRLGRLAERRGDYVALLSDGGVDGDRKSRVGTPHVLPLRLCY